jgi:colanic acid/amylovoran biosynthesis protein
MTRVLITNAYSARNRGDAAIILGMLDSLRSSDPFRDAEIRVSSADHPADAARYPVDTVPSFHALKNRFSRSPTLNNLYFLGVLLPASLLWVAGWRLARIDVPLPGKLRGLMQAYAGADLVVAAGGGYLYTTSATHGNVVLFINLYCFLCAVLLGTPAALYAQSIGPFAGRRQERLVRGALSRAIVVEVREEVSRRLLEGWRMATPVHEVVDAAFLLRAREPQGCAEIVERGDGPLVGMTVRRWFRDLEQQTSYERTMASFVDWLVKERDAIVVLLPQVTFTEGHDDDRETARRVASRTSAGERVRLVEEDLGAAEVKWLCGKMDLFVGTRMHSNIFALSGAVPTVAIAYQPKTSGIMSDLGLGEWAVPIEDLALGELQRLFDAVVERQAEIREQLARAIPELEARALEGGRLVADAFLEWQAGRGGRGAAR